VEILSFSRSRLNVKVKVKTVFKIEVKVVKLIKVVKIVEVKQNECCSFLEDIVRNSGADFLSRISIG
jgi:hypothetical protein